MSAAAASAIRIIAAVADDWTIGDRGALPWSLPDDLRRFRALTIDKPVVMGRKTLEAIGRPLSRRRNIVMSRTTSSLRGCDVVRSVDDALELLAGEPEAWVIGGAEVYRDWMPLADIAELAHVRCAPDGDTKFPNVPFLMRFGSASPIVCGEHQADATHTHDVWWVRYEVHT